MISALQPLHKLTHLRLAIETRVRHFEYFPATYSDEFICAVRGSTFNFTATAAALLPSHPSLRYLLLATEGCLSNYGEWNTPNRGVYEEWHVTKGWRVACEEENSDPVRKGQPVLVELAEAVVETIVWREELFVSEGEVSDLDPCCRATSRD